MPEPDSDDAPRGRRLTILFWSGVSLAPLAGLLLLVGGGPTALRIAAVLAVLSVVIIGLSITLRPGADEIRGEMEGLVLDEIDMLREDVRGDIASAARQTHQSLAERVQHLQQTVDVLRGELEAVRSAPTPPPPAAPPGMPGPPRVPGQAAPVVAAAPVVPAGAEPVSGVVDRQPPSAAGRAHVPSGMVRHTETVHHVTTRSTFVGHHADEDDSAGVYRGGYGGHQAEPADQGWPAPGPRRRPELPDEESWTDQKLRERYGRGPGGAPDREPDEGQPWRERSGRRGSWPDDDAGAPSAELPGGRAERSRWGSRHADDRSEELRLGERRAAMRASDAGTEMRIEDRWAAVRRSWDADQSRAEGRRAWDWEEPRSESRRGWDRDEPASAGRRSRNRDRDRDASPGDGRRGGDWDASPAQDGYQEPQGGRRERRALPAASEAPSWNDGWEEPEREQRGRRHRPDDDYDYPSGQRRFDFERSDERWG